MGYRILKQEDAFWRESNQMGVLNTDIGRQLEATNLGARLWRMKVAAGDIDPISTEAAAANGRLNAAAPYLRPVTARGVVHPALRAGAPYYLIFANILARPLRLLAVQIAAVAADDCELVLSGLLARDVAGVLSAYAAQGFALARRTDREGWATLLLRRGGAAPRPIFMDQA